MLPSSPGMPCTCAALPPLAAMKPDTPDGLPTYVEGMP